MPGPHPGGDGHRLSPGVSLARLPWTARAERGGGTGCSPEAGPGLGDPCPRGSQQQPLHPAVSAPPSEDSLTLCRWRSRHCGWSAPAGCFTHRNFPAAPHCTCTSDSVRDSRLVGYQKEPLVLVKVLCDVNPKGAVPTLTVAFTFMFSSCLSTCQRPFLPAP